MIRGLKIKTIMQCHHASIRIAELQKYWLIVLTFGKDMQQQELSFIASGNAKWYSHFERQNGSFLQN